MAESETYAHLEHLRLLGRVTAPHRDAGKLCYTPVPASRERVPAGGIAG